MNALDDISTTTGTSIFSSVRDGLYHLLFEQDLSSPGVLSAGPHELYPFMNTPWEKRIKAASARNRLDAFVGGS
jgi:hypothetical protein